MIINILFTNKFNIFKNIRYLKKMSCIKRFKNVYNSMNIMLSVLDTKILSLES